MKKQRGKLLTTFIAITLLGVIFYFYDPLAGLLPPPPPRSFLFRLYFGVLNLAHVVSVVGVWYWRKWAVYLSIVATLLGFLDPNILTLPLLTHIFYLVPIGLWFWAIYRKWEYFE